MPNIRLTFDAPVKCCSACGQVDAGVGDQFDLGIDLAKYVGATTPIRGTVTAVTGALTGDPTGTTVGYQIDVDALDLPVGLSTLNNCDLDGVSCVTCCDLAEDRLDLLEAKTLGSLGLQGIVANTTIVAVSNTYYDLIGNTYQVSDPGFIVLSANKRFAVDASAYQGVDPLQVAWVNVNVDLAFDATMDGLDLAVRVTINGSVFVGTITPAVGARSLTVFGAGFVADAEEVVIEVANLTDTTDILVTLGVVKLHARLAESILGAAVPIV